MGQAELLGLYQTEIDEADRKVARALGKRVAELTKKMVSNP
jgi:hypothetical protein